MTHRTLWLIAVSVLTCATQAFCAERKEIVIPATELAAVEQRADVPTAGKWWLNRDAQDWGAPGGAILLAGKPSEEPLKTGFWDVVPAFRYVPYRVPELVVDP